MKLKLPIAILACIAIAGIGIAYVNYRENPAGPNAAFRALTAASAVSAKPKGATKPEGHPTGLANQLPPGSSGIVFIDLESLRRSPLANELTAMAPTSAQDPQYTTFVRETGFDYSHDLDRVAVALWPQSAPTSVAVLAEGRFDRQKITSYALRNGKRIKENEQEIYEVPEQNSKRTIRFAFLAPNRIALADGPKITNLLASSTTNRLDAAMSARVAEVEDKPIFGIARTENLAQDLGVDEAHSAQIAHILQSVRGISLAGEPRNQNLDVSAAAECDSALDAIQLETILDGLRWMGRAALADPKTQQQIGPQWQGLDDALKAASLSHAGRFLRLQLEITPQMLQDASASGPKGPPAR
jgi:hypothetical protein